MPRPKQRNKLKSIHVTITPQMHGKLSELCWALDRPISNIIREMLDSDFPRFKDRHRKAISDGKKSEQSPEANDSVGS